MPPIYTAPQAAGLPRTPYLTPAEFLSDPGDLDITDLMPQGTTSQQTDVLNQKIWEASSRMDGFVHYVLGATLDTETARSRVRNDGYIVVPTRGWPVRDIETFLIGGTPSTMAAVSTTAISNAWVEDNTIRLPAIIPNNATSLFGVGSRVYCQWTYVNGWANTLLAGNVSAGATSIPVLNSLGIYAGMQLTIYDPGVTEVITVASSYVGGSGASTTIPLAAGLISAHNQTLTIGTGGSSGVSISALPSEIKAAAKLMTRGLIKTRGGGAIEMASLEEHTGKVDEGEAGGLEDLALAESFLTRYIVPYYG